jgi:hypothetical protein
MSRAKKRAPAKNKKRAPAKKPAPAVEPTWIAVQHVVWVEPGGERRPGRIAVAAPQSGDRCSMCRVVCDCYDRSRRAIFGADHMQALMLALRMIGWDLHRFLASGGQVFAAGTREDVGIPYIFGPLLEAPPSE